MAPDHLGAHPAVIYGALVEFAGLTCPLTLLENDLRQRAGDAGYRDGFIAHYLVKVIYPPGPHSWDACGGWVINRRHRGRRR